MTELPTIPFEQYELCLQLIDDMDRGLIDEDAFIRDCANVVVHVFENGVPVDV